MAAPKFPRPFNTPAVSRTVLPDQVQPCATLTPSRCTEGSEGLRPCKQRERMERGCWDTADQASGLKQ